MLREALISIEAKRPDDLRVASARPMLGGALLDQGKYSEAEPLLLSGYVGMKKREAMLPPPARYLVASMERIVRLYEATNRPDKATEWRKKLESQRAGPQKISP